MMLEEHYTREIDGIEGNIYCSLGKRYDVTMCNMIEVLR